MDQRDLRDAMKGVRDADVVWAEHAGSKHDGKFVPIWIAERVAKQAKARPGTGTIKASARRLVVRDETDAEALRVAVLRLKGPSAEWPEGLSFAIDQLPGN